MSSHPDSKAYRQSSPSLSSGHSNVVDHNAPDVTVPESSSALRRAPAAGSGNGKLITVEPLKKTEMQQSYAQDLGLGGVEHGIYGSFINGMFVYLPCVLDKRLKQTIALGAVVGFFGAIPCCPCPNPFQEVQQGSVGLVTRFGQFYRGLSRLANRLFIYI
jgi:hypothetical protein